MGSRRVMVPFGQANDLEEAITFEILVNEARVIVLQVGDESHLRFFELACLFDRAVVQHVLAAIQAHVRHLQAQRNIGSHPMSHAGPC